MSLSNPVTRVVGACLHDARERRMMLPEQSAEALGIDLPSLSALERGDRRVTSRDLDTLTGLYRCADADSEALRRLLALPPNGNGVVLDKEPGHARRFGACVDSASSVRWQSTDFLPAPLQTPHYALAVGEAPLARPGAPRDPAAPAVYVVDERVIQRGGKTAALMAEQVDHLLHLLDGGTDLCIVPGTSPFTQPPGHLVELHLPGGTVWARPGPGGVGYCDSSTFADTITASLDATTPDFTREALQRAATAHHALAAPRPRPPAMPPSAEASPSVPLSTWSPSL